MKYVVFAALFKSSEKHVVGDEPCVLRMLCRSHIAFIVLFIIHENEKRFNYYFQAEKILNFTLL